MRFRISLFPIPSFAGWTNRPRAGRRGAAGFLGGDPQGLELGRTCCSPRTTLEEADAYSGPYWCCFRQGEIVAAAPAPR